MDKVWTVWIANDEMETLLVGIATSAEKAYKMRARIIEELEDGYEVMVCEKKTDILEINDSEIQF